VAACVAFRCECVFSWETDRRTYRHQVIKRAFEGRVWAEYASRVIKYARYSRDKPRSCAIAKWADFSLPFSTTWSFNRMSCGAYVHWSPEICRGYFELKVRCVFVVRESFKAVGPWIYRLGNFSLTKPFCDAMENGHSNEPGFVFFTCLLRNSTDVNLIVWPN